MNSSHIANAFTLYATFFDHFNYQNLYNGLNFFISIFVVLTLN